MKPTTLEEICDAVRGSGGVRIVGVGSKEDFGVGCAPRSLPEDVARASRPGPGEADIQTLDMTGYAGIVAHEPADQVIVVRSGTLLAELREELARHRLCIPMPDPADHGVLLAGFPGTVGGMVSMNMPHGLYAQCGGPRDWVLGMTVVRGDGTVAKSGSRVVKSVAGYDVHKMFIGARGTLGVVAEVALQTYPVRAVPPMSARVAKAQVPGEPLWIQRVLPSDFAAATAGAGAELSAEDPASATIWATVGPGSGLKRFAEDWVMRSGCGDANLPCVGPDSSRLLRAAKAALDPLGKFNFGAMGAV